jgi:hypothetical protein
MDRRFFVTSLLTASGILAVTLGTANALPAPASRDHLAPADDGNIETVIGVGTGGVGEGHAANLMH